MEVLIFQFSRTGSLAPEDFGGAVFTHCQKIPQISSLESSSLIYKIKFQWCGFQSFKEISQISNLGSSMATFHFAFATDAEAFATGFLINKLDVSNNNSSDK